MTSAAEFAGNSFYTLLPSRFELLWLVFTLRVVVGKEPLDELANREYISSFLFSSTQLELRIRMTWTSRYAVEFRGDGWSVVDSPQERKVDPDNLQRYKEIIFIDGTTSVLKLWGFGKTSVIKRFGILKDPKSEGLSFPTGTDPAHTQLCWLLFPKFSDSAKPLCTQEATQTPLIDHLAEVYTKPEWTERQGAVIILGFSGFHVSVQKNHRHIRVTCIVIKIPSQLSSISSEWAAYVASSTK
ncbi:hypothetical protein CLF_109236 [Clonorchis sinensis]|uniref:Uncharacterized protein n=1 Tax=Clonorchis sinensis TaxID=79923 RepID=G7YSE6_CLOSI|nr:hypothetical protein CLF_109236 [Clonorchis sinensis]